MKKSKYLKELQDHTKFQKMMFDYVIGAGKTCSVAQFHPITEETAKTASRFLGNQVMLLPEEGFPKNNGNVMTPILQVNLNEISFVPHILKGKAWLNIFMDLEAMLLDSYENGENWLLKTYDSLEDLELREIPEERIQEKAKKWQASQITWTREIDVLNTKSNEEVLDEKWRNMIEEIPNVFYRHRPRRWFDESTKKVINSKERFNGDNIYSWHIAATKIGGFPTFHQHDDGKGSPSYPANFNIQIMNNVQHQINHLEEGKKRFDLCDCSTTYIGFIEGEWVMETQTS